MPTKLPRALALTVIGRLEAATSRLEDMVPNIGDASVAPNGFQPGPNQGPNVVEGMGQPAANGQSSQKSQEALPPVIDDFDHTINDEVKTFVNMSEEIGGLVAEQVQPEEALGGQAVVGADQR